MSYVYAENAAPFDDCSHKKPGRLMTSVTKMLLIK